MFHSNTQQMIDYWRSKCGLGGLPVRADIDPTDFPRLAPQVVVLGRTATGAYPIRLAGGLVADLHDRNLRGVDFLSLVSEMGRLRLHTALEMARRRPEPVVARIEASTDHSASLTLEVLLAPLAGGAGSPERLLGLYQPLSLVAALGEQPIRRLDIRAIRGVGPANEESQYLRLATLDGRRVA